MKRKIYIIGGGIGFCISLVLFVIWNVYFTDSFRTMQDPIPSSEKVDLRGLREIQASGGDLPRFPSLQRRLQYIKVEKMIVNAEFEKVEYAKGIPTSLLGYRGKTPGFKHYIRRFILTGTTNIRPDLISAEAKEAEKYGFQHKDVIIGSRFTTSNKNIEEIVTFFDTLPKNIWLHFHCAHGLGRTSMLLIMLDIMKNAPEVALQDIVKRQHLLGSVDVFDTTIWDGGGYTKEQLENRKKFIEKFYEFVVQRKAGGTQRWSDWNQRKKELG